MEVLGIIRRLESLEHPFFTMIFISCVILLLFRCSVPDAPPSNVTGQKLNSTAILVQWDEVPIEKQHGEIKSYTVVFWKKDEEENEKTVYGAGNHEATLGDLDKYTDYDVQVFASTIKGPSRRRSPKITVRTDQDGEQTQ